MLRKEEEYSYCRLSIRRDLIRIGIDAPSLGFSPRGEASCFPSLLLTAKYEATARPEHTP
jgi:hypothetical protein